MQITTETFGNVMVAHTPDEMTDEHVADFIQAIEEAAEVGHVRIVAQMDRTDLFDSYGLSSLVDLQEKLRERDGNLKISGLEHHGRKIFEVTRLDRQFDVFESVIDAVASFQ